MDLTAPESGTALSLITTSAEAFRFPAGTPECRVSGDQSPAQARGCGAADRRRGPRARGPHSDPYGRPVVNSGWIRY